MLQRIARDRPLIVYFALAYGLAWMLFLPMALLHGPMELVMLASLGPTAAALITHKLATGNFRAFRVHAGFGRTLGVSALGVVLMVASFVILPGLATADPGKLNWSIFASTSIYNYSTLLGGPLGEEPGWRGFALPRLEALCGPLRATLLLALLWAGWHLPLYLIPTWTSSPMWIYVLLLTGCSILLTFAANLARFAVIPVILMHAAFNTASQFLNGFFRDTEPHVTMPFELVLALCGLAISAVLLLLTKARLSYSR